MAAHRADHNEEEEEGEAWPRVPLPAPSTPLPLLRSAQTPGPHLALQRLVSGNFSCSFQTACQTNKGAAQKVARSHSSPPPFSVPFAFSPSSAITQQHANTHPYALSQRASVRPPPTRARVCCSVFCFPPLAGVCARRVKASNSLERKGRSTERARAPPTLLKKLERRRAQSPACFGLSYAASALPPATSF